PRSAPTPRCSFHRPPSTEIYPLSLHDALPILEQSERVRPVQLGQKLDVGAASHAARRRSPLAHAVHGQDRCFLEGRREERAGGVDRKSTRLNSSHLGISYAVFCLKKKKKEERM